MAGVVRAYRPPEGLGVGHGQYRDPRRPEWCRRRVGARQPRQHGEAEDGPLEDASLHQPSGRTTDGRLLYVVDSEASAVRVIDRGSDGTMRTIVDEEPSAICAESLNPSSTAGMDRLTSHAGGRSGVADLIENLGREGAILWRAHREGRLALPTARPFRPKPR